MKNVSESLAGRIGILDLNVLSNRELNNMKDEVFIPNVELLKKKERVNMMTMQELFSKILKGSYPELHNGKNSDFENYYESYIRTYIERDVRTLINIKDENKFIKFVSSVAARTAQEYNSSDICNDIGVDNKTVDSWLSILKNTGLVYLLSPYSNNNVSRIIKRPKIYFMDTGLACYLAGYTDATVLEKSAYNGAIFETYIITEIIKSYTNNKKNPTKYLYYYRDNNQNKIDLIIIDNDKLYPVEIKKSSNPGKSAIKNFGILEKFGMEIPNGSILCMSKDIFPLDNNNYYIPIEYI